MLPVLAVLDMCICCGAPRADAGEASACSQFILGSGFRRPITLPVRLDGIGPVGVLIMRAYVVNLIQPADS